MKTFTRLIRRYVLAVMGITAAMLVLAIGVILWVGWRYGAASNEQNYFSWKIAAGMVQEGDAFALGPEHTPEEWMAGYAWAMILGDDGSVLWSYQLPEELNHPYTPADVASFARWYLGGYPVTCWVQDYGLFVIAKPIDSVAKYNFTANPAIIRDAVQGFPALMLGMAGLVVLFCVWFSWRGTRRLQEVAAGLDALAQGETVSLSTDGYTGELAEKLNQTSAQLQTRNQIIARRDTARTNWIAGVSHDIRTPLALILGWAEQLQQDPALPEEARSKAGRICGQSERISALIEDLNLTSKLQYGAQPLRCKPLNAGSLLRRIAAKCCESLLADRCELALHQTPEAEQAVLNVDEALLRRAVENLLNNSVRHNTAPVHISLRARTAGQTFVLTVADDGKGYPPQVLRALYAEGQEANAPHILGLHVVEQILQAHGGSAAFAQNIPKGARAILTLPLYVEAEKSDS